MVLAPEYITVICSAAGVVIGAIAKPALDWLKERSSEKLAAQKQEADLSMAATDRAVSYYEDLVKALNTDIANLRNYLRDMELSHIKDMRQVQEQHTKCVEENATLKADVRLLKGQVGLLLTVLEQHGINVPSPLIEQTAS